MKILTLVFCLSTLFACGSSGDASPVAAPCNVRSICEEGTFCSYPLGNCGQDDVQGTCEVKPEMCAQVFQPVCGCDNKTYSNQCEAASRGVSVKVDGACEAS